MGEQDLHIFVDMKTPRVHVSFKGNTKQAQAYMGTTKDREMSLRHIRVDASDIRIANQDGEIVS